MDDRTAEPWVPMPPDEPYRRSDTCSICGEAIESDAAEMHDAARLNDPALYSEAESGIVHAECGLARGWEMS